MYAEPIKPSSFSEQARTSTSTTDKTFTLSASDACPIGEVQLRPKPPDRPEHELVAYENATQLFSCSDVDENIRYSDSQVGHYANRDENDSSQKVSKSTQRKFHSKSFSLSENRIAAGLNLFQQNRDLWEKRTEMQSQPYLSQPSR